MRVQQQHGIILATIAVISSSSREIASFSPIVTTSSPPRPTTALPATPSQANTPCASDTVCDTDTDTDTIPPPQHSEPSATQSQQLPGGTGLSLSQIGPPVPTVWSSFASLGSQHPDASNLGQGFPDWLPPKFCVDALVEAVTDTTERSPHQYTRSGGHGPLVEELAGRYGRHLGRDIDGMAEVAVTVGASQALYLSLQTLVRPGDEVILFEPFFDLYVNQVKLAGGTPIYVPLTFSPYKPDNKDHPTAALSGGEWILEPHKLHEKITPRTRAIILNSPHNPTGKIFSLDEMRTIADAVQTRADPSCVVLSDEVYKYIVHSNPPKQTPTPPADPTIPSTIDGHTHFASLPNMYDRTITISSAGKTFSATGWQVGWTIGPPHLISPIHRLVPHVQFCPSTVIQDALARALPQSDEPYRGCDSYHAYLVDDYRSKRDVLSSALTSAGFAVPDANVTAGGGFFLFARIGPALREHLPSELVNVPNAASPGGVARLDWALCEWLTKEVGVLCIPATPFFSEEVVREGGAEGFVRVAFCKKEGVLREAEERLRKLGVQLGLDDGAGAGDGVNGDVEVVEAEAEVIGV